MQSALRSASYRTRPVLLRTTITLPGELEAYSARFSTPARRDVRNVMRTSARLAELAIVFPGAVYALATRRGATAARQRAIRLVEQGAPLKAVARALDVPLWLRRLPPEAFSGLLGTLPATEAFTRKISTRLPSVPQDSAFWLATLTFAVQACHEDFAIWLAEQQLYGEPGEPERLFGVLAAYAAYSRGPACRAQSLIVVPWRPEIAFDTALCAAKSWLNRLRLVVQLGQGAIADTWMAPGAALGFTILPITDTQAILDEAHAMQNCADQYADRLARDKCRLFSVRKAGVRVATLEVGPHARETGVLTITQLKARHNMPASVEVWQAAHAWLSMQVGIKRLPPMVAPDRPLDTALWTQLMAPYRTLAGPSPWLPSDASHGSFTELDLALADLARRAGVSSWLFT